MTKYKNVHACVECGEFLTEGERMYSDGRCPKCGHKGKNACTIVDTKEYPAEWIPIKSPWWYFGRKGYWKVIKRGE